MAAQTAQPEAVAPGNLDYFAVGQMAAGMIAAGGQPGRQRSSMSDCVPKTSSQSAAASMLALEDVPVEESVAEVAVPGDHAGAAALALPSGNAADQGAQGVEATFAACSQHTGA